MKILLSSILLTSLISCNVSSPIGNEFLKKLENYSLEERFFKKGGHCGNESNSLESDHLRFKEGSYFLLYNLKQLESLASDPNAFSLKFRLMNHIDLDNSNLQIGSVKEPFTGEFDGNYCELRNLQVYEKTKSAVALFPYADRAYIKNLAVRNFQLEGLVAGSIVAFSTESYFQNILVLDSNIEGDTAAGLLLGAGTDSELDTIAIINSRVEADLFVGGVAGKMISFLGEGSSFIENYFLKSLEVEGKEVVGGIIGSSDGVSVSYGISNVKINNGKESGSLIGESYYSNVSNGILFSEIKNILGFEEETLVDRVYMTSVCSGCKTGNLIDIEETLKKDSYIYEGWPSKWVIDKNFGPLLTF